MLNHWKEFEAAIKNRYGHWSSGERAKMLSYIKSAEKIIEEDRLKGQEDPQIPLFS